MRKLVVFTLVAILGVLLAIGVSANEATAPSGGENATVAVNDGA